MREGHDKPPQVFVGVKMPHELRDRAIRAANEQGWPLAELVREALRSYVGDEPGARHPRADGRSKWRPPVT